MFCKYKIEAIDKDYYDGIIVVYNFEVEDNHNYYVGDNQVLVHNDGCTVSDKGSSGGGIEETGNRNSLNPNKINFSQRSVSDNVLQYVDDMKSGNWDWDLSGPIRVMERDGQWVSYDNRRLMAAQQAGLSEVPFQVIKPMEIHPDLGITWDEAYVKRFNDKRNIRIGGPVPNNGLSSQPKVIKKRR